MNKLAVALAGLLAISSSAHAVVVVPPAIYFLTLSLSSFLANALVSLVLFGALKGIADRTYAGKSVYQWLASLKTWLGIAILAVICMTLSALAIYPLDWKDAIYAGLLAAGIFFALKAVLGWRSLQVAGKDKMGVWSGWILLALFVGIATGVSALLAVQAHQIGGNTYKSDIAIVPMADIAQKASSAITSGAAASSKEQAVQDAAILGEQESQGPTYPSIWFQPVSPQDCFIQIGSFTKLAKTESTCATLENGVLTRSMCPVEIARSELPSQLQGNLPFAATQGCMESGTITVNNNGFSNLQVNAAYAGN